MRIGFLSLQTDHNIPSVLASVTAVPEEQQLAVKKMSMRTAVSSAKISDPATPEDGEGPTKRDAAAYEDARTYVFLEMELQKPLIAKRPATVLADR